MSIWIANGNNIRLAGDLPRRAYRARLDAQLAQPWLRRLRDFKHPDLIKWVQQRRGDIIAGMLTIARAWVVAGKPEPKDLVTIGSYESFCEVLGGILGFVEVEGFLKNLQQMYTDMDVEIPQWGGFLEAWREIFGDLGVTVAQVVKKLNENEGFATTLPDSLADRDVKNYSQKLGNALARRKDVRFPNGLTIQAGIVKHHATAWEVVKSKTSLPSFSFGGEPGELGPIPRAFGHETDNGENNNGYINGVQPASPASPPDTKIGEAAKNNAPEAAPPDPWAGMPDYPHESCPACGGSEFWPDFKGSRFCCSRCHPQPPKIDMEV